MVKQKPHKGDPVPYPIARCQEIVDRVSRDKDMPHEYLQYEMALSDETSRLEDATKEAHLNDAKKALINRISPELTSKITGLPLKTVKKLQKDMGLKK
jgi:hypothetical protein